MAKALEMEHIKKFIADGRRGIPRGSGEGAFDGGLRHDGAARGAGRIETLMTSRMNHADGTGRVLHSPIEDRSGGEGNTAYLARGTVRLLRAWLEAAYIREGAVFRRLVGRGGIGGRLGVDSVAEIFKRVAGFVRMDKKDVESVSGHSVRVRSDAGFAGAHNIDLAFILGDASGKMEEQYECP